MLRLVLPLEPLLLPEKGLLPFLQVLQRVLVPFLLLVQVLLPE
jgi:hypothetical protein